MSTLTTMVAGASIPAAGTQCDWAQHEYCPCCRCEDDAVVIQHFRTVLTDSYGKVLRVSEYTESWCASHVHTTSVVTIEI